LAGGSGVGLAAFLPLPLTGYGVTATGYGLAFVAFPLGGGETFDLLADFLLSGDFDLASDFDLETLVSGLSLSALAALISVFFFGGIKINILIIVDILVARY
jgi:hypothetical protein